MLKQVCAFLGLVGYYKKFIRNLAHIAKPLTINLSASNIRVDTYPSQCFLTHKESVIQAAILHYPNLKKCYIVHTDVSDDACRVQLSQEYDGTEFPIAFHSHTFPDTQ